MTTTVRYDNIMTTKGGDNMRKRKKSLLGKIKNAFASYQDRQKRLRRQQHVEEQHRLIYEGLEDRGD